MTVGENNGTGSVEAEQLAKAKAEAQHLASVARVLRTLADGLDEAQRILLDGYASVSVRERAPEPLPRPSAEDSRA